MLHRFAVVSSARMDPTNLGGAANDLVTETRMRKMLLKNIGILYYHMPVNHDPKSLLYEDVEEVKDIDKMAEDFFRISAGQAPLPDLFSFEPPWRLEE